MNGTVQNNVKNILIAGVGGQGTLLASKLMGKCFIGEGYDVKVSEVHGMSQRGGSVVTYVRYGDKVDSSQLEAARWLPYLKPGGVLIASTQRIDPMPVIMGKAAYPEDILQRIRDKGVQVVDVDALALALEAGSVRSVNVVLLGVAARFLGFEPDVWLEILRTTVPPRTVSVNEQAFRLGYDAR